MRSERLGLRAKVSLGMPVFNGEKYIEEALDSILGQMFDDFELLISDNASTDRTEEICRDYAAKDARIKFVRNRVNYGVAFNFNNAFRLSSGKYFKWAASDDVCGEDLLRRCVAILDADPSVVLAYAKTTGIDDQGAPVALDHMVSDANSPESTNSPDPLVRFRRLLRNPAWVAGPFFGLMRSDVLGRTPLHGNFHGGDHVLIAELALHGRFYEVQEDLFFLRMHAAKGSAIQTLPERVAFMDVHPLDQQGTYLWRLARGHIRRVLGYAGAISRSPIGGRERALCDYEVARAAAIWLKARGVPAAVRAMGPSGRLGPA